MLWLRKYLLKGIEQIAEFYKAGIKQDKDLLWKIMLSRECL